MTRLELAFTEIQKLPPGDQNEFIAWILEELHSEKRWVKVYAKSSDILSTLSDDALVEHKNKRTRRLA